MEGFKTVVDSLTQGLQPDEFQIDELNRKVVIKNNKAWYTLAVTMEFDAEFHNLQWRYDPTKAMERLKASPSRTITLTTKGIVEGLVG